MRGVAGPAIPCPRYVFGRYVWSADGKWILFDRVKPEGGDVWVVEGGAAPEARP